MNRLLGLMSLCRKAGKLSIGFEPVKEAIETGEANLVLYAEDFSPRSRERMEKVLARSGGHLSSFDTDLSMDVFSRVCGKRTGVVAIGDSGFAVGIEKLIRSDKGGAE